MTRANSQASGKVVDFQTGLDKVVHSENVRKPIVSKGVDPSNDTAGCPDEMKVEVSCPQAPKMVPDDTQSLPGGRAAQPAATDPDYRKRDTQCREDCRRLPKMELRHKYKAEETSHRSRKSEAKREGTYFAPELADFTDFLMAVGPRPGPGWTLDRRDNTKGYELDNVRWANSRAQNNNRSNNIVLQHSKTGEEITVAELAKRHGLEPSTIYKRRSRSPGQGRWTDDEIIQNRRYAPVEVAPHDAAKPAAKWRPRESAASLRHQLEAHHRWIAAYRPWGESIKHELRYMSAGRHATSPLAFAIEENARALQNLEEELSFGSPFLELYEDGGSEAALTPDQRRAEDQRLGMLRAKIQRLRPRLSELKDQFRWWKARDTQIRELLEEAEARERWSY